MHSGRPKLSANDKAKKMNAPGPDSFEEEEQTTTIEGNSDDEVRVWSFCSPFLLFILPFLPSVSLTIPPPLTTPSLLSCPLTLLFLLHSPPLPPCP